MIFQNLICRAGGCDSRRGATAAEYAIVIAAAGLVAVGGISLMSNALNSALTATANQFDPGSSGLVAGPTHTGQGLVPQAAELAKPEEVTIQMPTSP